ncbi:MAG: DNA polymerase III subunit gamma/tau, partial [Eubacterium sp.]|nr:DNA polymerase III subunit gamma/tau [Eubacterium sp.]
MYQVLYRKYRPRIFADVYGQEHVTSTLQNEIQQGRISHAYLFTGSRGTGKTTCAKILAKAVNCENAQNGEPCNECEVCKGLDNGSIYDVVEIDAASNNGVDNIRDLREEANYTPTRGKYRVYIIDEVHMLSTGAFNALLKTLEEPPAHVIFILATTEVHKLPATILSRCQRFDFKRIQPETMAKRLHQVAELEGIELENDAAILIARIADGALRDGLSILDQCASRSKKVTSELVSIVAGLAGKEALFKLSECISAKQINEAINIIADLYQYSFDMERLCVEMINHFRNYLIVKTVNKSRE